MKSSELTKGIAIVGGLNFKAIGVVDLIGAGAPTDGTSGTGNGVVAVGGAYWDKTNNLVWTNIGTKASPQWAMFQQTTRVALTAANILGMFAAPVSILAAPAAGRIIVVDSIVFANVPTATQFAAGGAVSFVLHGGAVAVHSGSVPAAVVNSASASITQLGPATAANGTTQTAATGIDITNASGAFTTGTGTAIVFITYGILPTT